MTIRSASIRDSVTRKKALNWGLSVRISRGEEARMLGSGHGYYGSTSYWQAEARKIQVSAYDGLDRCVTSSSGEFRRATDTAACKAVIRALKGGEIAG